MVAQWENECISLSVLAVGWVQFPGMSKYFKEFFFWLITLCQPIVGQYVAENDSISPQWHHTSCGH